MFYFSLETRGMAKKLKTARAVCPGHRIDSILNPDARKPAPRSMCFFYDQLNIEIMCLKLNVQFEILFSQ